MSPNNCLILASAAAGSTIADHNQDSVRWCVPLVVKVLEHRASCRVEGALGAQGIVRVGRAREHIFIETADKFVRGIGKIARDFLLDCASFLVPLLIRVIDAAQAGSLRL